MKRPPEVSVARFEVLDPMHKIDHIVTFVVNGERLEGVCCVEDTIASGGGGGGREGRRHCVISHEVIEMFNVRVSSCSLRSRADGDDVASGAAGRTTARRPSSRMSSSDGDDDTLRRTCCDSSPTCPWPVRCPLARIHHHHHHHCSLRPDCTMDLAVGQQGSRATAAADGMRHALPCPATSKAIRIPL